MPTGASRRHLLLGAASVAPAALLVHGKSARAFSAEPMTRSSSIGLAYANRCGGDGEHAQILGQLQAGLAARSAPSGTTLTDSAVCPICGCPIVATRRVP